MNDAGVPPQEPAISHEVLSSIDEVAREREAWDRLVCERYHANPFLSMDWQLLWLRHFAGEGREILYVVIRLGESVSYFPMLARPGRFHHQRARVLGYAGNIYSPVNCPLIGADEPGPVFDYFARAVLPALRWDVLYTEDLPAEYPGPEELRSAAEGAGYTAVLEEGAGNRVHDNPDMDAEAYYRSLKSNHLRKNIRSKPRRLKELGELTYRLAADDLTPDDVAAYQAVYGRSWKESETDPTFHPELMEVARRAGWLRVGILRLDGRPIAAQLRLVRNGRAYMVKTAFDEEFRKYSPGIVLTWYVIERLMTEEGVRYLDYLKGNDPYKDGWASDFRRRYRLTVFNRGLKGAWLRFLDRSLLPRVRRNRVLDFVKRRLTGAGRKAP